MGRGIRVSRGYPGVFPDTSHVGGIPVSHPLRDTGSRTPPSGPPRSTSRTDTPAATLAPDNEDELRGGSEWAD